jgi:hypothetical protein
MLVVRFQLAQRVLCLMPRQSMFALATMVLYKFTFVEEFMNKLR